MTQDEATILLIRKAQAGDRSALEELYVRYVPRVLAAVRCRLGPGLRAKVESWDVLQDVMMRSLEDLADFEPRGEGAFLHWLGKAALNRIRDADDFFRAGKRDMARERPLEAGRSDAAAKPLDTKGRNLPSPSEVMSVAEDMLQLERALDQLPDEERELIVSRKIEGMTYEELAAESGVTADAVRMRVNRAMAKLVDQFEKGDPP